MRVHDVVKRILGEEVAVRIAGGEAVTKAVITGHHFVDAVRIGGQRVFEKGKTMSSIFVSNLESAHKAFSLQRDNCYVHLVSLQYVRKEETIFI